MPLFSPVVSKRCLLLSITLPGLKDFLLPLTILNLLNFFFVPVEYPIGTLSLGLLDFPLTLFILAVLDREVSAIKFLKSLALFFDRGTLFTFISFGFLPFLVFFSGLAKTS